MNEPFEVLRYQTSDGQQPFTEWIYHLKDRQAANLIWARVDRLESGHFGKTRHTRLAICGRLLEKKMKRFSPYVSHRDERMKELKDAKEAIHYLNACATIAFEENDPDAILMGIYNVARAQGLTLIAKKAKLHRETLSRMLSKNGNPEWGSLFKLLKALNVKTIFQTHPLKHAA